MSTTSPQITIDEERYLSWLNIEEWTDERDFVLEWEVGLPDLPQKDYVRFQYDQMANPAHRADCTLYSSFGALCDLYNYNMTAKDIEEVRAIAHARGKIDGEWRDRRAGMKVVADRWNLKNPGDKAVFFYFDLRDKELREKVLKKGYSIVSWIIYWVDYYLDRYRDGIVGEKSYKDRTRWHALDLVRNNGNAVKDSMANKPYNVYQVTYLDDLIANRTFKSDAWIFVRENDLKSNEEEIKKLQEMINILKDVTEKNSKLRNLTTDKEYRKELEEMNTMNRKKIAYIQTQI